MAATDTSGVEVTIKREVTFGTSPSGTYYPLRITSDDLIPNVEYVESQVIRPDGQIEDVIQSGAEGSGSIGGELQFGEWDEVFLAGLLSEDWPVSPVTDTQTVFSADAAASGVPLFVSTSGPSFVTTGFTAGMWIKMAGWTSNTLNSVFKVVGVNATTLFLQGSSQGAGATEGAGNSVTITQLGDIANGKTINTYTLNREHTDDGNEHHRFPGQGCNGFTIEIPTEGPITVTSNWLGKIPSSETSHPGSVGAFLTTESMTSGPDFSSIYEGNPEVTVLASSGLNWDTSILTMLQATINVSPNLRPRKAVGTVGPAIPPGRGDIGVTGSVQFYYNATAGVDDSVLFDKLLQNTISGLAFVVKDSAGLAYVFDMPRLKYTSGRRSTPGKSEDVIVNLEFQAYRNPVDTNPNSNVTGTTFRVARGAWPAQT